MSVFLTFLYIFNFNIIRDITYTASAFFVFFYLCFSVVASPEYNREISKMIGSKYNRMIVGFLLLLISLSIFIPVVQFSFDFTYTISLVHQLICLEIGIMLIGYLNARGNNIIEVILNAFGVQSLIQIGCLISPSLLKVTDVFRSADTILKREQSYVGFRGLAISGSAFFGLAVAYAIVFIVLAFYWDKWKKQAIYKATYTVLLSVGALSAGRIAVIGMFLFIIVRVAYRMKTNKIDSRKLINAFVLVLLFLGVYKLWLSQYLSTLSSWVRFRNYLTQAFSSDGSSSRMNFDIRKVSSLNNLFENMYFRLSLSQIIFGDGKYMDNGLYYMHTDVGYLRNLLFGGIGETALLYIFYIRIIMKNAISSIRKKMAIVLIMLGFILDAKGQMMGFLIISQSLLVLICNSDVWYEES